MFIIVIVFNLSPCQATEPNIPLHIQIDNLVSKRQSALKISPAKISTDEEFVRRVYLDLNGVIPTAKQARLFLDNKSPDKRQKLIDELFANTEYALSMARVFDVMLTERRIAGGGNLYDVPPTVWKSYLASSFANNKPWDQMVREILGTDGSEKNILGASKFYNVRDVSPHLLTRDIGRLFLGCDLQCAQCHDDPHVKDYRQADYYGIYAFVQRLKIHPLSPKGSLVAEGASGKTTFTSVFTAKSGETFPLLPGRNMIPDPAIEKDKEYIIKPGPKEAGIPAYSRRFKLAELLPQPATKGFSRNIANRLWALMMEKGIVHPLDLHHDGNPPSYPELLDTLEKWMVDHNYDIKEFLREIALSKTYQRSSVTFENQKEIPAGTYCVAPIRGLSAEQLRWSVLQATGRIEQYYLKIQSQKKSSGESSNLPYWNTKLIQNEVLEKQTASFITAFAGLPGQPEMGFNPIVDQALYLRNNSKFLQLLKDEPGLLLSRLSEIQDVNLLSEELYLSLLSRRPNKDEIEEVIKMLANAKVPAIRLETLQALMWGLLLSAEFRLNH